MAFDIEKEASTVGIIIKNAKQEVDRIRNTEGNIEALSDFDAINDKIKKIATSTQETFLGKYEMLVKSFTDIQKKEYS